jgi:hypothetical protein
MYKSKYCTTKSDLTSKSEIYASNSLIVTFFHMKTSSIPILFLISVYVDNDWDDQSEGLLLGFLISLLKVELINQRENSDLYQHH